MHKDVLINVNNVSKKFCRDLKKSLLYGIQDVVYDAIGISSKKNDQLRGKEFYALNNISFELKRGDVLGLIGKNGAGKTTLLKILNGLIKPDTGSVIMRGRVGALIALGAGFNPILTGRENIYINGAVLGLTKKEINAKLEDIIEFSEIGDFIDSPVQNYSSGMQVRLGFAVASVLQPDILLIDEVLAVGDSSFRFKCYQMIDSLLKKTAVVFVSHNMPDINRICTKTIVLTKGEVIHYGDVSKGISVYEQLNSKNGVSVNSFKNVKEPIIDFQIFANDEIKYNQKYEFELQLDAAKRIEQAELIVNFFNESGGYAGNLLAKAKEYGIIVEPGVSKWKCTIEHVPLKPAKYFLAFHLLDDGEFIASESKIKTVTITNGLYGSNSDCVLNLINWSKT